MPKRRVSLPIRSEHLRIRRFEWQDVDVFVDFMTNHESTKYLAFDDEQKSREGAKELIKATIDAYDSDSPMMAFAVEDCISSEFVGFCGLTPRTDDMVEIMYAVIASARGKGYAVEIAATLAQYATNQLGYKYVTAPISREHEISKAVALKAGFKDCGFQRVVGYADTVHLFVFDQSNSQVTKS